MHVTCCILSILNKQAAVLKPAPICSSLFAVLPGPPTQVRLLADVLLGNLGFASLVVHLEPVAATFGHGATTACIVNIRPESTSICCVEDGAIWPQTRTQLAYGTDDVAVALERWLGRAGLWPGGGRERQEGYAVPSMGRDAAACQQAAMEAFRNRHCYYPKVCTVLSMSCALQPPRRPYSFANHHRLQRLTALTPC